MPEGQGDIPPKPVKTGRTHNFPPQLEARFGRRKLADVLMNPVTRAVVREQRKENRIDPLTGAYNRRYFDEQLKDAFALTKRSGEHGGRLQVGVLMFDLDHFKAVNDQFGHSGGDAVLKKFVETIKPYLREPDVFARIGGEEFALLIRGVEKMTPDQVTEMAVRLKTLVAENVKNALGQGAQPVTVSMGLSLYPNGAPIEKPEDLVSFADQALYKAKEGGRNQVVKFTGLNEEGETQFSRVDVSPKG